MGKIKIYTCHHKPSAFLSADSINPLHVGKTNSYNEIGCIGDNTGNNISFKNPFYCELTAHYWVWKNEQLADFIGFMHYRRHFNFSDNQNFPEDNWGCVNYPLLNDTYEKQFGLDDQSITHCLKDTDILVPKKWMVTAANSKNNYEHYKCGDALHIKDYQIALDLLNEMYPEYMMAARQFNNAVDGYYTNMYVMRRDIFEHYSEWLFSILNRLENRISLNNYNAQEKRVIGHISERLFNIYLIHQQERNHYRIKELQRTFIMQETFNGYLRPSFEKNNVPIVICFDDNYALCCGALLNSIITNSTLEHNYDIIVLDNNISSLNKQRLNMLIDNKVNIKLRFFNLNTLSEIKEVFTRAHFSAATYGRLFIPRLFRGYDKVVFIDADTVVESDIAELMHIDIGNNLVAAVKDIVMEGFVKFGAMSDSSDGVMPSAEYLQKSLGMTNPDAYFQAGIIVFNILQMNTEGTFEKLMFAMKEKKYWFLDQDIMNKVFYGRVHYLPLAWNVYHGNGNTDTFFPNLKFSTYMAFLEARCQPKMIHYAGEQKPWNTTNVDFFENFMKYISNTPWQRDVYLRLNPYQEVQVEVPTVHHSPFLLQTKIKIRLMPYLNRIAPQGSVRRNLLTKYYYKVRRIILG
ncbi:glycosyl transferase [Salmonella enterica subsp. enterica serovar Altendorf]|uniref:DUF4422 domain-containing protein n=1 Tax=Salmonella enterica TaxID=28901 RepID=UPI000BA14951|nr:DUF4422 domain-containing protein [Salmonella enterica]OZU09735.1 glycosyl transferase [Salmonella enterica subsp. enterica serovar Altendorf]HAF5789982.1 DUF4422 domain-containing protein [Salmonella enterica]